MNVKFLIGFSFVALVLGDAQQGPPQLAPQQQQQPTGSLLGVRFSAATDVSRVAYNSPLVSYGASLEEIQLPASPIQPANLKQVPQAGAPEYQQNNLVRNAAGEQVQQVPAESVPVGPQPQFAAAQAQLPANSQFLSVQQYPSNPQFRTAAGAPAQPQQFVINQNLPGPQPQAFSQPQPQAYAQPQPQYQFPVQQAPVAPSPAYPAFASRPNPYSAFVQQYPAQYPVQQPLSALPQPQLPVAPAAYASAPVTSNAYFATGPFAAPQPAAPFATARYNSPPVPVGYPSAPAALVSRVAFNRPGVGFSYGF
ncbi:uncharacterized protein LOC143194277 [Rhynchophorus ferrugineus]|uniref:Uncharacterized protein n=1 Tax=Rhynchophorus ferrugineus TaxID=354439 RepID=A0A834MEI2_RHYFE|nr:hypothetical protein GWI33_004596 [Rhynchophorus ferrugineus]